MNTQNCYVLIWSNISVTNFILLRCFLYMQLILQSNSAPYALCYVHYTAQCKHHYDELDNLTYNRIHLDVWKLSMDKPLGVIFSQRSFIEVSVPKLGKQNTSSVLNTLSIFKKMHKIHRQTGLHERKSSLHPPQLWWMSGSFLWIGHSL